MFYVYVLHSLEDHGLYTGFSTDLRRRMAEHKQGTSFATLEANLLRSLRRSTGCRRAGTLSQSGGVRRFLCQQLRHYFEKFPVRQAKIVPVARHVSAEGEFSPAYRLVL